MTELAKTFKALSDESRLRILGIILRSEELCVCDIEYVMQFTQTKVSRHLSYLKNAGLVEDRRQGLWVLYRMAKPRDEARRKLIQYLEAILATHPGALEDVKRLKESINGGCCTGYACVRPETARLKPTAEAPPGRQA